MSGDNIESLASPVENPELDKLLELIEREGKDRRFATTLYEEDGEYHILVQTQNGEHYSCDSVQLEKLIPEYLDLMEKLRENYATV